MSEKYPKWLREEQDKGNIVVFEHTLFRNINFIGKGGFGLISSADYDGVKIALKSLKTKEATREFVNELKQLRTIKFHPNVNQFYGITIDPKTDDLMLVLEFANEGNLREYLQSKWHDNVFKISLNEIIKIANQITLGLMRLHESNIIHCDLHPKNILKNNDRFLIADFGLARKINDSFVSSFTTSHGAPAYIDPQCHINPAKKRDAKSDVYSLGIIFWELTSGIASFESSINGVAICVQILQGYREDTIPGTPFNFSELYKNCWDINPQNRPTTKEILTAIEKISEETVVEEFITNKNRKTIPILTRNGTSNLFSVGPSVQMLNEPSLKNLKKSSSNELIELKAQGLICYEANNYEGSLNFFKPNNAVALRSRGQTLD
ncbi:kinase-like protein [Gigaspora margarita]|uniref:Kinase-like protein n=1 Tax=Gigaspora margarita TaxID=4874 RepID=A0A8H4EVK0_GIGMA|nr:kinase-like protein [Gigaspora margarita]